MHFSLGVLVDIWYCDLIVSLIIFYFFIIFRLYLYVDIKNKL